jgi:type VI protein secretion system component VasF
VSAVGSPGFGQDTGGQPRPQNSTYQREAVTLPPDANAQMRLRERQARRQSFEAMNTERMRQLGDDTSRLLALATELKTAVDKASNDSLSVDVIRKVESIEKLANGVKEKMKLTVGAS